MIFVTVGTQLPFDRLIQIVDEFSETSNVEVKGQIGLGAYQPKNIDWKRFYDPDELDRAFDESTVLVSHAGMGSIINGIRLRKPIILFPRLSSLGEHRNDHQLDTLESFNGVEGVYIAKNKKELLAYLNSCKSLSPPIGFKSPERDELCKYIMAQM